MKKNAPGPSLSLDEITGKLREVMPQLRFEYEVKKLGVFGSYATGTNKPRSDLDLLVEFERAPTMFDFVKLERRLTEELGINVDLVMKSALKPGIAERILSEVVPV